MTSSSNDLYMTSSSNNYFNNIIPEPVIPVADNNYPGQLYNISTPGNLLWLITVFNGATSQIKYIKLLNNINMSNQLINAPLNINNFIFDGNFKTIININCKTFLINQIDNLSSIQNVIFNNYQCESFININEGTIINCKFNNGKCKSSALVNRNSNLISNCRFNNITLTTDILITQAGVVANTSTDLSKIELCRVNNIIFMGDGFFGGIVGNLIAGTIVNSSVSNIRNDNINSQTYKIGGICGKVSSSDCSIDKCNIDIITNNNTSIIIGKIMNSNIKINCLTFKTKKGDKEDNKPIDLKYNREAENIKREAEKKILETSKELAKKAVEKAKEEVDEAIKKANEIAANSLQPAEIEKESERQILNLIKLSESGMQTTEKYRNTNRIASYELFTNAVPTTTSIINNYMLFINVLEGTNIINMNNIFKMTSENKMSKLDYSFITYDDILCSIELPKIPLSKSIDTAKLNIIKNNLINSIKQTSLLDVNVSSVVDGTTLYITISDALPTTSAATSAETSAATNAIGDITTSLATMVESTTSTLAEMVESTTSTLAEIVDSTTIMLAEHFELTSASAGITDVVYIYDTSNNTAIMDAINSGSIDPAIIAETTTSPIEQATSTKAPEEQATSTKAPEEQATSTKAPEEQSTSTSIISERPTTSATQVIDKKSNNSGNLLFLFFLIILAIIAGVYIYYNKNKSNI